MRIDLHTHSSFSDGVLTPAELLQRAARQNVDAIALTDHDETGGLAEAAQVAGELGIRLIAGVEISVSWREHTLHVLGLGIHPEHPQLKQGLSALRAARLARAMRMGERLQEAGIPEIFRDASALANGAGTIGRHHLARSLVARGCARNTADAFKRFLVEGKPGFVAQQWASLVQAIDWIRAAGGIAVLAHPERYRMPRMTSRALLEDFKHCGGEGLEICRHDRGIAFEQLRTARQFGFTPAAGSDFHAPEQSGVELGVVADIGTDAVAVWLQRTSGHVPN